MFGQDVKMIETILYFLSMISKDQEFYFQFVQTTRLCCLLLWKWKNHNATSENVTKMLKNTLPSIELNHSNGDGRLEELISKLSR